jgi:hypothetical protein
MSHTSQSSHAIAQVGFVVDNEALGQVFSKYFGFPCQFSFHQLLHTHNLSSRADTIGQLVADVPSGLRLTPPQKLLKRKIPYLIVHFCTFHYMVRQLLPAHMSSFTITI